MSSVDVSIQAFTGLYAATKYVDLDVAGYLRWASFIAWAAFLFYCLWKKENTGNHILAIVLTNMVLSGIIANQGIGPGGNLYVSLFWVLIQFLTMRVLYEVIVGRRQYRGKALV